MLDVPVLVKDALREGNLLKNYRFEAVIGDRVASLSNPYSFTAPADDTYYFYIPVGTWLIDGISYYHNGERTPILIPDDPMHQTPFYKMVLSMYAGDEVRITLYQSVRDKIIDVSINDYLEYVYIDNNKLVSETVKFDERMCSSTDLKFGLCEGTSLEFQYFDDRNITGHEIRAFVDVEYENENGMMVWHTIPMGYFTVDESSRQASTGIRKVTAYNKLKSSYLDNPINAELLDLVQQGEDGSNVVSVYRILDHFLSGYSIEYYNKRERSASLSLQNPTRLMIRAYDGESGEKYLVVDLGAYVGTAGISPTPYDDEYVQPVYEEFLKDYVYPIWYDDTSLWEGFEVDYYNDDGTPAGRCSILDAINNCYTVKLAYYQMVTEGAETTADNWINASSASYNRTDQLWGRLGWITNTEHSYALRLNGTYETTPYRIKNHVNSAFYFPASAYIFYRGPSLDMRWPTGPVVTQSMINQITSDHGYVYKLYYVDVPAIADIDITVEEAEDLPDVTLRELQSSVYETVCQFGKLDRETDMFTGVELNHSRLYPANTLYPADDLYPNSTSERSNPAMYSKLWADEGNIRKFRDLIITYKGTIIDPDTQEPREVEKILTRTVNADGTDDYNMSNNWLFKNLVWTDADIGDYADAMVAKMQDVTWFPYEMWCAGLPYIEAGDEVEINMAEGAYTSYVLRRTLKGIQNLQDEMICGTLDIF